MKTNEYLNLVTEQLRCKKARTAVAAELKDHIQEQTEVYCLEGNTLAEAEARAVKDMGDPVETGIALDRIHRPRMAWKAILFIVILSFLGLAAQFLAASLAGAEEALFGHQELKRLLLLLLGLTAMLLVCLADYSIIGKYAKHLYLGLFFLLMAGHLFLSRSINGSTQWIVLGPLSFNIPLLSFLFIPLYGAVLYSYRGTDSRGLFKSILWTMPPVILVFRCPSPLIAQILFFSFVIMLSAAIHKKWFRISRRPWLAALWGGALLLPLLFVLSLVFSGREYQAARIQAILFHPDTISDTMGWKTLAVKELLSGSQILGGRSQSSAAVSKLNPTDFVLTYLTSSLGILAAVLLVTAIAVLLFWLLKRSLNQKNLLGRIMGFGCGTVLLIQLALYVLANTGIGTFSVLLSGVYCPFLTYGGTACLVTYILLGILLSVYRWQQVLPGETRTEAAEI